MEEDQSHTTVVYKLEGCQRNVLSPEGIDGDGDVYPNGRRPCKLLLTDFMVSSSSSRGRAIRNGIWRAR